VDYSLFLLPLESRYAINAITAITITIPLKTPVLKMAPTTWQLDNVAVNNVVIIIRYKNFLIDNF
jgi:hypothetical protein